MSSSTCFISRIYHDWENMEIKELNYLLTKKMQRNFICAIMLLVTDTSAINARWKDQLSKIRRAITHHSWLDLSYTEMGNQSREVGSIEFFYQKCITKYIFAFCKVSVKSLFWNSGRYSFYYIDMGKRDRLAFAKKPSPKWGDITQKIISVISRDTISQIQ